jgi:hypothetical protein
METWSETGVPIPASAWPFVLSDLQRLGATPGEVMRVAELVDCGLTDVALALVDTAFRRLRGTQA